MSSSEAAQMETGCGNNDSQVDMERNTKDVLGSTNATTSTSVEFEENGNPRMRLRSRKTQQSAGKKMASRTLDRSTAKKILDLEKKIFNLEIENGHLGCVKDALCKLALKLDQRNDELVKELAILRKACFKTNGKKAKGKRGASTGRHVD